MIEALIILARNDDTGAGKVIFFIIIFVIWGISALVSWINKQSQEARRREQQMREQFNPANPPPLPPPFVMKKTPRGPRPVAQAPLPPPILRTIGPVPPVVRRTPKPQRPVRRPNVQPQVQPIQPTIIQPVAAPPLNITPANTIHRPTSAGAPAIARWLKPATLKSQFILTELLRPPIALRDDESL